jgi:Antibiotic biosynthesis monooxygenase
MGDALTHEELRKRSAPMVIGAGHITVDPEQRESYLADCMSVVEKARRADGCLDVAITADLLDPGRVNLFERWSRKRPSNPSAGAALATSKARQHSRCR